MGAARRTRAAAIALALAASPAAATPDAPIPPECGSRAAFESELHQRLGSDTPLDGVHVEITPTPPHYNLRVKVGSELRELDDESCTELFRASIVIAMSLLLHDESEPEPVAPTESEPSSDAHEGSPRPRFTLGAGIGINAGILPSPVAAFELESKALWPQWGLSLGVRYLPSAETPASQERGVRLRALGAHLGGIYRPARPWEARLGFGAQRLTGEGIGTADPQQGAAWVGGPTLGASFIPFESELLWAGLGAEGQLNLIRGKFEILNYNGDVYDVALFSGSAFVRLGLIW
jgi:hypothetical protein